MGYRKKGMYNKFIVVRTDGRSGPGERHHGCRYLVLDLDHDPNCVQAVRAYSNAVRADGYELLADDLDRIMAERVCK